MRTSIRRKGSTIGAMSRENIEKERDINRLRTTRIKTNACKETAFYPTAPCLNVIA